VIGLVIASMAVVRLRVTRGVLGAYLFLAIAVLFLTFSRAGWVALVPTAAVFAVRASRRISLLISLSVVALAVAVIMTPGGRERITTDMSGGERPLIYRSALRAYLDNPVLGLGYGDRIVLKGYRERYMHPEARREHSGTHNIILQQAVETGTVGLIAFAALHLAALLGILRMYRRCTIPEVKWMLLWGVSTIVAFFTIGQLHTLYRERNLMLFWLVMGIMFALGKVYEIDDRQPKAADSPPA
jgi:O-antigen ligase